MCVSVSVSLLMKDLQSDFWKPWILILVTSVFVCWKQFLPPCLCRLTAVFLGTNWSHWLSCLLHALHLCVCLRAPMWPQSSSVEKREVLKYSVLSSFNVFLIKFFIWLSKYDRA